jgi:Methylamine utilisation protein MauE
VTLEAAGRLAAVALGLVLLLSSVAKLARRGNASEAAGALGVPVWAAMAVPWVELVLGALLVAGLLLPWTAAAAALVLVAFSVVLLRVLVRGEHPRCRCFGSLTAGRVTWWSVARNVVLLALAGLAMSG